MIQGGLKVDPVTRNEDFGLIHAPTSPIVDVKRTCLRIAPSEATVLLTGETGTGKEVFARLLHAQSGRQGRPFVPVNCGAIPETLLESELFGYVKGAFTGAVSSRRGRVASAEGGTLFLDEVGELPLSLQVKLLRLLQERSYEPVGSSESVTANFRLVAATNSNLEEEVRAGRFRRDLYYRLHVCPIQLLPLRDRREDIEHLFIHFWRRRGEQRPISSEAMRRLEAYDWPGNVRELENLVERLSVCAEGRTIEAKDLPSMFRGDDPGAFRTPNTSAEVLAELVIPSISSAVCSPAATGGQPTEPLGAEGSGTSGGGVMIEEEEVSITKEYEFPLFGSPEASDSATALAQANGVALPVDLPKLLRELENAYINRALNKAGGNKKEAAKLLGMGRTTLVEKLRRRGADASGL